jgi:hypothetical protein
MTLKSFADANSDEACWIVATSASIQRVTRHQEAFDSSSRSSFSRRSDFRVRRPPW